MATASGLHHYDPERHGLTMTRTGDLRPEVCRACLDQTAILQAPAVFVIAAVLARMARKYGELRSQRYIDMEVGHAAQNLLLQAAVLGLAGVPIGAFHDEPLRRALALPEHEEPRYLVPIGRPR